MRAIAPALAVLLAGWLAGPATAQVAGLVTGPAGSTYARIGADIVAEGAACDVPLDNLVSSGALENAQAVRNRPGVQLGLVQEDVLEYARTLAPDDAALQRIAQGLRVVMPLHAEEIHLLASRDVADLADLAGRRVSLGAPGSGSLLTGGLVLDLTETAPGERIADLDPADALEALIAGRIDAMFLVGGAPVPLLADPRLDPARFHLLPLTDPVLRAVYMPTRIPAASYPVAPTDVDVVAVRAVLMTYDFSATGDAYHRQSCAAVADVAQVVLARLARLQASGHPKWREIDPSDLPAGWLVSPCALTGLDPERPLACDTAAPPPPPATTFAPDPALPAPNALYLQRVCARVGC